MTKRTVNGKVYWWTPERMQIDVYIDGVFSREFSYDGAYKSHKQADSYLEGIAVVLGATSKGTKLKLKKK